MAVQVAWELKTIMYAIHPRKMDLHCPQKKGECRRRGADQHLSGVQTFSGLKGASVNCVCVCVCVCAESALELTYTLHVYTFCGLKGTSVNCVCVCAESVLELTNTLPGIYLLWLQWSMVSF